MKGKFICGVYKILNAVNNKIYVGQSIDIITRWERHKFALNSDNHCNYRLQKDWNKYKEDNFEIIVVKECDRSLLLYYESKYIKEFNAIEKGYNIKQPAKYTISIEQINSLKDRLIKFASKLDHGQLITTEAITDKLNITTADISIILKNIKNEDEKQYNTRLQFNDKFRNYIEKVNVEEQLKEMEQHILYL